MKRIIGLFLALCLTFSLSAQAASLGGQEIDALPEDWTVTATPDGHAGAEMENGDLRLYFDTTQESARGRAEVTTSGYQLGAGAFTLSMETTFTENGDRVSKTLTLLDDKVWNAVEALRITGGSISLFGGAGSARCTGGTPHALRLAVDPEAQKGAAWIDGVLAWAGTISWKEDLDLNNLRLLLQNSAASSSAQERSEWRLNDLTVAKTQGTYSFTSLPADGQAMVAPGSVEGIDLHFGTRLGDSMYRAEAYGLTCNGEAAAFTLQETEEGVRLAPTGGLRTNSSYVLTIAKVVDLWGDSLETDRQVAFTTSYDGYAAPEVTIAADAAGTVYVGQAVAIACQVTGQVEQVEILVNGETEAILTAAPWNYTWTPETPGVFQIQAAALDSAGGYGYSETLTLTAAANNPPTLTVEGITDGGVYDMSAFPVITATAQDDNGVAEIWMESDGAVVQRTAGAAAIFTLNGLPGGKRQITITAADVYGVTASQSFAVTLEASRYRETYRNDFSDYTGNNTLPREMIGGPQRGYLDVVTVDEDHGKSLAIGIETANPEYTDGNTAWVGMPMGGTTGTVVTDFDLFLAQRPADRYRMSFKQSGGTEADFLYITGTEIQFCGSNASVAATRPYEPERWYHFTIRVNVAEKIYQVYLDGEPIIETGAFAAGIAVFNELRVFGPADDAAPSYAAVDNVVIQAAYGLPTLTFESPVDYQAKSVRFTVSQPLLAASLTPETVQLADPFGPVALATVDLTENTVTLTPAAPLHSNLTYTVTLGAEVRYNGGYTLGLPVVGSFQTTQGSLEIVSGNYEGDAFVFQAKNQTGQPVQALVITQIWDGQDVKRISGAWVSLTPGTEEYRVTAPQALGREERRTYIWDGLAHPTVMTPFVFTD